ncbi:MAG TPA: hypothetical protein PKX15_08905, partial [Bacteroidales bacterium]|nr:hypothetical protein [Bacteroidales bacterium]
MESPEIKNPIYTLDWDRYYPVAEKFSIELFNGKFFYVNYKKTEPLVSSFKIYSDGILYAKYHNVEDEFEYKDYNELRRGIFKVIEELKLDIDKIYIIDAEFCHLSSFKKAVKENRAILIGNYFVDRISDLKLKYTLVPYMVERMKKDIYYISKIFSDFKIWIQIERKNSFAKLCFLFPNHKKDYRDFAKAIEQLNLWQHICEKNPKVVE